MLKSLYIKDYALIEKIEVQFESGLNILTGETGAGKSIIIDAMSLLLGERASTEEVRKGTEKAIVEGVFNVSGNQRLKALLEQHKIECDDELILRRDVSIKGQSRCFINDTPATLSLLKEVGDLLVDLHGQHEHQSLLKPETHIELLDDFAGLGGMVEEFKTSYQKLNMLFAELKALKNKEALLKEKKELYEFQIKEIDAVNPRVGEMEQLETELKILENAERLYDATNKLYQTLYENENSIHDQLVLARNQLEDLSQIDKSFNEAKEECRSAEVIVDELRKFIQSYNSRIEFNPERLEEIRDRLGQLTRLKKKYGGSLETVIEHRAKIGGEYALAENFETEIQKIETTIESERRHCSDIAQRLSAKRREVAGRLSGQVVNVLKELGISNGNFEVKIENRRQDVEVRNQACGYVKLGKDFYETTQRGIDFVEFYISTNIGEDVKPLVKVASGGEISRVMLALKMILAKSDRLPLLVFDEIDIGISGRIAQKVGVSLKTLSNFHQIIAITHLPQIAGLANTHYLVEKIVDKKRAVTTIRKLELDERVREIAKLMSGEEVTEASLRGARELMEITK